MSEKVYSWNEYKQWVSNIVKNNASCFCRGQVDPTWKLQTSFHRLAKHNNISIIQYLDNILPDVQYHIGAVCNEYIDLTKAIELGSFLALVQHYGFPTPLLDWTFSPYIAAYFAYREVNDSILQNENVKIYVFDHNSWSQTFKQIHDLRETVQYVSIIRPYAKHNQRIIPQQSIFTVTNIDDMEQYIMAREIEVKKQFLYTALLSVKEKSIVMKELNLMGINEMTMFPSIDGICRALKTQYF